MKKSDIVKELQKDIDQYGDQYVLSFRITDEFHTEERAMLSPTRKDAFGTKRKMSIKEFVAYVKEEKAKASTTN